MGRFRFVLPETVRLPISDGDWVDVKKHLNHGEREALTAAGLGDMKAPTKGSDEESNVRFDFEWDRYKTQRLFIWLTDWSFADQNGNKMKVTKQNIELLDPDTVDEIQEALSKHIEAIDAEKKVTTGSSEPKAK